MDRELTPATSYLDVTISHYFDMFLLSTLVQLVLQIDEALDYR